MCSCFASTYSDSSKKNGNISDKTSNPNIVAQRPFTLQLGKRSVRDFQAIFLFLLKLGRRKKPSEVHLYIVHQLN